VVLVDGQPQRRRGAPRDTYIVKQPSPAQWKPGPASDYVQAAFDENFGGTVKRAVTHTRAVLFVKPDFWVVLDTLDASDGRPHTYDALFHFDAAVKTDGFRAVTQNVGEANLTVAARPDAGLTLHTVEGQESPVQGWLPVGMTRVRPAPVAIFTAAGVHREMLYVLAPAPKGAPDPVKSVEPLAADPRAARVVLTNGKTYEIRFGRDSAEAVFR
jgi:hypothetical protein